MLSIQDVSVAFGPQTVLSHASLTIQSRTKAGLVGANGSGKTTLLKVLAGVDAPDSGKVQRSKETSIAYLPQHLEFDQTISIRDEAEKAFSDLKKREVRRAKIADLLATGDDHPQKLLEELADIDHLLEHSGYFDREVAIARVLSGLGFPDRDHTRTIESFSGGWQMRVALAKVLLSGAEILLLDEPTNYLDKEARDWLLQFLRQHPGGVVIVSHDRSFLDDLITEVLEVFHGNLRRFPGNYSSYIGARTEQMAQLVARYEKQLREIAHHEKFIRRFRANAAKARQVQSRIRLLEKIEPIDLPEHLKPIHLNIPHGPHCGRDVLSTNGLGRRYGDVVAISDLDFQLSRGDRVAVVGPNGAGKSTFLRICSGGDTEFTGELILGTGVQIGYFAQDSTDRLPKSASVLEYCESCAPYDSLPAVRDLLGAFLFSGDSVHKPIGVLSGGERTRVVLASLLLQPVNLLILDEPTNHLDITSKEVLARALADFTGAAIFVSHDRYFLSQAATTVLEFWPAARARNWRLHPGDYTYYQNRMANGDYTDSGKNTPLPTGSALTQSESAYVEQKKNKREIRTLQKRESRLMHEIDQMEEARRTIEQNLADPEIYRVPDNPRIKELTTQLTTVIQAENRAHETWEEVSKQLLELERTSR